jgi:hypothetical protein
MGDDARPLPRKVRPHVHVLITRAMRNVGDDLIHQRARELIAHVAPQLELVLIYYLRLSPLKSSY